MVLYFTRLTEGFNEEGLQGLDHRLISCFVVLSFFLILVIIGAV